MGAFFDRVLRLFGFDIHCGFWFFSSWNIQIILSDRKTCFFWSVSGFPPVASAAAFSLLHELGTVEPRLSGLVGT